MQLPVTLRLRPSRQLALALLTAHLLALVTIGIIPIAVWARAIMFLLVGMSLWHMTRKLYGDERIVRLSLETQGIMAFTRFNEKTTTATVLRQSTVTPWLSVILLKLAERLEAVVIMPDSLSKQDYRCLRLWLRWLSAN